MLLFTIKGSSFMHLKKFFKWLAIILFGLALSFGFFLALLPTIASSNWGKAKIESLINQSIAGNVSFKKLNVSFFGPQQIETIILKDPDDQFVLSIEELSTDLSLPSLVFKRFCSSNIHIQNLTLNLIEGERGDSNVRQALQSPTHSLKTFSSLGSPLYFHAEKLDVSLEPEFFSLKTLGTTYQNELQGTFSIDAAFTGLTEENLKHLTESPELLMRSDTQFRLDAKITNLPVALLDWALAMKDSNLRGIAQQTIGPQLNLSVRNASPEHGLAFEIEASSANLNANMIANFSEDRIAITKPGTIRLSIAPALARQFLDPSLDIELGRPTNLLIAIEQFVLPINKNRTYDFKAFALKGRMDIREALLKSKSNFSDILLDQMSATIETREDAPEMILKVSGQASQNGNPVHISLETWLDKTKRINFRSPPPMKVDLKQIPLALLDELLGLGDKLQTYVGQFADLTLDTILQKDSLDMAVEFRSEKVHIPSLLVKINDDITLLEPVQIHYQLDEQKLGQGQLPKQSLKLKASLEPIKDFQNIRNLSQLDLSGIVNIDQIAVQLNQLKDSLLIQDLSLPWEVKAKENKAHGEIHGYIYIGEKTSGKVDYILTVTNWLNKDKLDLSNAFLSTKAELKQIPVPLIAEIIKEQRLSALIGPLLDLTVDADLSLNQLKGKAKYTFLGEGLQGTGQLEVDHFVYGLTPFKMNLKVTPERFTTLRSFIIGEKTDHLTLADSAQVTLNMGVLVIEKSQISFTLNAETDRLVVIDTISGKSMTFENIQAKAESMDLYKKLDFNITAHQKSIGQTSDFIAKGVLEDAFLHDGSFNKTGLTLLLDVNISDLPLSLFCDTFCVDKSIDQKIEALFGPTLNVNVHTALKQANGPVQAILNGPTGQVTLDARIENGMLYLNQPFHANFTATKALGHSILQDIFPLLSGTVSADQPFKITIEHSGFAFPIRDFDLSGIQISKGTLSLGDVKFTKDGQLGEILSLLTPADANLISVWFTPLYFSMNKGELNLSRIDMLISNHFPIAAWGTLNFPKDKIQMMIGLSGDAISYAFNVDVDSEYMLKLPLKGKIASPSLDKSKATTKIGALVAHSQKSTHGSILGAVLDLASGGLTDDKPPRPTTQPFPWEKQTEADRQKRLNEENAKEEKAKDKKAKEEKAHPVEKEKTKKEKKSDSSKIIEKAANSLIDNFLKH